ncbi:MAG: leucine-rich repeat protein [Candidatus Cryptobacteroides sp.]
MKNQLLTAVCSGLASVFLSVSCSNDNCSLKEQMNDLDSRVAKLEEMCSEMNTNINALQTLVNALQNKEFIESVSLLPDGEGYSVVFSSGKTIALYNGTAPIIGVKQDIDGSWYWTLDGDWLYADGAKICASSKTPQLKIENGQWFISYDGGKTWQESGKASGDDAGIISITQDEDYVHFEMQDGTVITIAKYHPLSIQFDTDDVAITNGGENKTIGYTLGGASESVIVKAIAQDGWKVKVETVSSTSGTIEITSPDPITESEILVFVNDNGRTVLAVLNCVKSTIIISQEQFNVPSIGGRIEVRTESNMDYNIVIPEEAQAWLSLEQTKAMSSRSFCLIASKNQNPYDRCTTVSLTDKNGTVIRTFVVLQYADPSGLVCIAVDNAGELHSKMKSFDKSKITALKILGVLNDVDFLDIYYEMPSLKYLDISEVDIERLPEGCFRSLKTIETYILPNTLVEIQDNCFSDSSISGNLIIPASCTLIGDEAFKNCGSLTSVIIPASCETIGMYSFYTCNSLENVIFEPNSKLRSISRYSFSQTALKEIVIPASCELIVDYAFQLCKSLETVNFEPNSKLTEIRSSCFSKTPLKDITIPASCKIIGAEVFADCAYLEKIEFEPGSELEIIGELTSITAAHFPIVNH